MGLAADCGTGSLAQCPAHGTGAQCEVSAAPCRPSLSVRQQRRRLPRAAWVPSRLCSLGLPSAAVSLSHAPSLIKQTPLNHRLCRRTKTPVLLSVHLPRRSEHSEVEVGEAVELQRFYQGWRENPNVRSELVSWVKQWREWSEVAGGRWFVTSNRGHSVWFQNGREQLTEALWIYQQPQTSTQWVHWDNRTFSIMLLYSLKKIGGRNNGGPQVTGG